MEVGTFESGTLGTGAAMYKDEDGNTYMESAYLPIRKKAMFTNITVKELKHVGGELILSPAAMICSKVEQLADGYKCYFNQKDSEGRKIFNEFEVGDQARCQTFTLEKNTYYWRVVTAIGTDFIVLSKTDCDANSDIPKEGDNISLLGNRTDASRQKAIILSAYGPDAPSYKQYKGINSYSMEDKEVTTLSPNGNRLTGIVNIESGSTGAQNLADLPDEIFKAVNVGAVNLLRNSGFTGDYQTEELDAASSLTSDLEMYSKALEHWTGTATINTDTSAISGRTATIGNLSQSVKIIAGESYVLSFLAKGTSVDVSCGVFSASQTLDDTLKKYSFKFVSDGNGTVTIMGNATIGDLMLERGTIPTDWMPSPYDNDKSLAEFQAIQYLSDAIKEGDTSILGGLILSSMIMLGNYKDGTMQKVTSGMSGIYSDDDDIAFWAGGTLEQAIRTMVKFMENPRYKPTDEEWEDLAKFVVSHGGYAVFRGTIFAENGIFRGRLEAEEGFFHGKFETSIDGNRIVIDPEDKSFKMYNGANLEVLSINFSDGGENWTWGEVNLKRYNYDSETEQGALAFESRMSASNIDLYNRIDNTWTRMTTEGCQITASTGERHYNIITSLIRKYNEDNSYSYRANVLSDCWENDSNSVGKGAIYAEPEYDENGTLISSILKVKA